MFLYRLFLSRYFTRGTEEVLEWLTPRARQQVESTSVVFLPQITLITPIANPVCVICGSPFWEATT
jgi:hypothetical protein